MEKRIYIYIIKISKYRNETNISNEKNIIFQKIKIKKKTKFFHERNIIEIKYSIYHKRNSTNRYYFIISSNT